MSFADILAVISRRWVTVVLGLLLTVGGTVLLVTPRPLYWTQTDVLMVAPGADVSAPTNESQLAGLIAFAGLVSERFNDGQVKRVVSSASATLYGMGVRRGQSVSLVNVGGQWESSFSRPVLSVEVVDSSPDRVDAVRAEVLRQIDDQTTQIQDELGVPADGRISAQPVTPAPVIHAVGSTRRGEARAAAAYLFVGIALTLAAAVLLDRRRQSRPPAPAPVTAAAPGR